MKFQNYFKSKCSEKYIINYLLFVEFYKIITCHMIKNKLYCKILLLQNKKTIKNC